MGCGQKNILTTDLKKNCLCKTRQKDLLGSGGGSLSGCSLGIWNGLDAHARREWKVYFWNEKENIEVNLGEIHFLSRPGNKLGRCS